jgi:hypothetical protein
MEMGEQQGIDFRGADAHQVEVAIAVLADVDHKHLMPSDNDIAGPSPPGVGHGRACTAQAKVETVSKAGQFIAPRCLLRCALEYDRADLLLKQECRGQNNRRKQQKSDDNPPHHDFSNFKNILALRMPLSKRFRSKVIENAVFATRHHYLALTYASSWRISRKTRTAAKGRLLNAGVRETNLR